MIIIIQLKPDWKKLGRKLCQNCQPGSQPPAVLGTKAFYWMVIFITNPGNIHKCLNHSLVLRTEKNCVGEQEKVQRCLHHGTLSDHDHDATITQDLWLKVSGQQPYSCLKRVPAMCAEHKYSFQPLPRDASGRPGSKDFEGHSSTLPSHHAFYTVCSQGLL